MRRTKPATERRRHGLTVIELLCVMAIIGLLVGLIGPAVARAREAARRVDCCSRMREVGLALMGFEETHGALPAGWTYHPDRRTALGWATLILPWLEQRSLSDAIRRDLPLDDALNAELLTRNVSVLSCPSDPQESQFGLYEDDDIEEHLGYGQSSEELIIHLPSASYVGVFGIHDPDDGASTPGEGAFVCGKSVRFAHFERGQSQTMLVSERTARKLPSTWLGFVSEGEDPAARVVGYADRGPNRADSDEADFDSRHPGQINVLWGDGRVEAVGDSVDARVYRKNACLRP